MSDTADGNGRSGGDADDGSLGGDADDGGPETDGPTDDGVEAGAPWTPGVLREVRTDRRRRAVAIAAAAVVGLAVAWLHWLGLFVAGALVGLVSRTLPRAVLAGVGVGALAVALTVAAGPDIGVGEFLALRPPVYVALGAGLLAPAWGALVRGVV